jgi:hypothetical protein
MNLDPDTLAERLSFANRVALWRARGAEGPFLALVAMVAITFALMALEAPWHALVSAPAVWNRPPAAVTAAVTLAFGLWWGGRTALKRILDGRQRDWLAALPIASARREAQARRVAWRGLLARASLLTLVLLWLGWRSDPSAPLGLGLLAGCAGAVVLARWPGFGRPALPPRDPVSAALVQLRDGRAGASAGLALLGVAIAPIAVRIPRLAWPLGTGLLLMPVGAAPLAVLGFLVLVATAVLSGDLVAALRRRLAGDRGWLAALPLAPRRLLGGYAPTLWRAGVVRVLMAALGAHLVGAPLPWMLAAAVLLALALLHGALLAFAARLVPGRFPLWTSVHLIIVLGALQVLPPIAPILWLALLGWSWRQAVGCQR